MLAERDRLIAKYGDIRPPAVVEPMAMHSDHVAVANFG
jgi:hypothetical protein